MIFFRRRYSFLPMNEYWYDAKLSILDLFRLTTFSCSRTNSSGIWFMISKTVKTIDIDLEQNVDELVAGFKKSVRQQVRIAESEGIVCRYENDIALFCNFFNEFARSKGIAETSADRLYEMKNNLLLSFAEKENVLLAAHSYIIDNDLKVIRCYHSGSARMSEAADKNLIGRANKYLHYQDMLYFKNKGFKIYDFGGFADDSDKRDLSTINNFKLQFGGNVVENKNYVSPLYAILRKIGGKLKLANAQGG